MVEDIQHMLNSTHGVIEAIEYTNHHLSLCKGNVIVGIRE